MGQYVAPRRDMQFVLHELLHVDDEFRQLPPYTEVARELIDQVIEQGGKFAAEVLFPLNQVGDVEGCRYADGVVTTPPGFKAAYERFREAGWPSIASDPEFGGQGLPHTLGYALEEVINSANQAFAMYPCLTHGAYEALHAHGTDEQKRIFLPKLVSGQWTGTMCLTEPQCGTDLGLLRTKAEPNKDGSYRITGTKIFVSSGEHDLAQNIVHLVLARLPDAPAGSRGISMFIVPKYKVNADGSLGERNSAFAGAIEHKMGIKGSATCVMNFDGAEGYLIGKPHKGLMAMFTMMNAARLAVGVQGLALAERALQNSLNYARERLQSRALSGVKFPDKPADNLLAQPDVRRMLLTQRAFVEGTRLLVLYNALQVDIEGRATDEATRQKASELVAFLIPISKGVVTELAIECTKEALQIYGGHGYIGENGMEQFSRDARITTLYEGTTGIQAADLLGRKILQLQGVGFKHFLEEISGFCQQHSADESLRALIGPLAVYAKQWGDMTVKLAQRVQANPEELGAAANDYLYYSGYVTLAYLWARSVAAADKSSQSAAFKQAKRDTASFYFTRILPRCLVHQAGIEAGVATLPEIA
ncbi:acyl-CoA dehydrogenase C-terminal domain-containing protein [Dyella sp.]|uniref:acyl-CoA dehydrogenase C-terminal domain-containing protein n=1 Tax=Dyella sp. TaxID=1869338 RepID=UPI002D79A59F|nr:acyl-CoA dehydrogenase C-terminal domain-containing protein [Dyella sp.]HET6431017.1 acyl-CoA dehydrogenase C-terminal domain-containing protein [Dyella sp.]